MSSSGSDSGDEDYVPSDCGSHPPSEVESDGDEENSDICDEGNDYPTKKGQKGKMLQPKRGKASDNAPEPPKLNEVESKDVKEKSESLWSDFLKDVTKDEGTKEDGVSEKITPKSEKKVINEVYEFAGERVNVSTEVDAGVSIKKRKTSTGSDNISDSASMEENIKPYRIEESKDVDESKMNEPKAPVLKGSALGLSAKSRIIAKPNMRCGGSNLSSALNKLGKKNKLSTLEKSKLDWESYKNKEGITEEISAHNKGKSGYLDKQDFLEKTDLKQYELEKQLRNVQRRKL